MPQSYQTKYFKIFFLALLAILMTGLSSRLLGDEGPKLENDVLQNVPVYYVPVTNYFSERTDFDGRGEVYLSEVDKGLFSEKFEFTPATWFEGKKLSEEEVGIVRWDRVTPDLKTLSFQGKYLWQKSDLKDYGLVIDRRLSEEEAREVAFDSNRLTKVNLLGDIMLSRHVNTQMKRLGYDYPWQKVWERVADADITFANLEVPITDRYPIPTAGMSFVASTKNLEYLKKAGIDIVSVANNHTANFGTQAFKDNLENLKKAGIHVCGGGLTESEARSVSTIKVNDTKFNFLCQSAITGSLYAEGDSPGVPYLGIEPWYRQNQNSLNDLVADIEKDQAGVVVTSPHWGVEYKQYPNNDQKKVARLMIDGGADLVIGTHPHVVQSLEFYNGGYISYSLGNFIFDQEWSTETKQGVMASAYFYNDKNVAVRLVPLQIENYAQPRFVEGEIATKILNDIKRNSIGF